MTKSIVLVALVCASSGTSVANAAVTALCTVLADASTGKVLKQEGHCDQRLTPASTFKVALGLMGYDAGYLTDEHLPALPFHPGDSDWLPEWRQKTDPTLWISNSVVWYSQRFTEWLGAERFQHYVAAFKYGNQDLSGNPGKNDGLTHAWLSSSLKITALEELGFMEKIVRRELPVAARAYDMTARITMVATLPNGWEVHGKTGTGAPTKSDGTNDESRQVGWFVGWASNGGRTIAFARCVESPAHEEPRAGLKARAEFLQELPALLDAQ